MKPNWKQAVFDFYRKHSATENIEYYSSSSLETDDDEHFWHLIYKTLRKAEPGQRVEVIKNKEIARSEQTQTALTNAHMTGQSIELKSADGQAVGLLLQYNPEESKALINQFKQADIYSERPLHQGVLSQTIVNNLSNTSTLVASGLQMGQLFRAVGPPELLSGLSSGAYQMVQSSSGALGSIKSVSGSQFVGNLRFASASVAPILAPVIVYQVLHALVGTHQLSQINHRLEKIEQTLEDLKVRQELTILGEIHYAIETLDDLIAERLNTGTFTPDMSNRLAVVEKSVVSLLERSRLVTERFRARVNDVKAKTGKQGARGTAQLIKKFGQEAIQDMQCLVALIAADLKLEQALLLLAMQNNPTDIARRQERLTDKIQKHRQIIEELPSFEELQNHALQCQQAMKWWEKLFDFGQTDKELNAMSALELRDIHPSLDAMLPHLNGYMFWQDDEGTHIFAIPGDDLQLLPTEVTQEPVYEMTVLQEVEVGKTYDFVAPVKESDGQKQRPFLSAISIHEQIESNLWLGKPVGCEEKVLITTCDT